MFLLASLVDHSLSENRGPRTWARPEGAVRALGAAAKLPRESCPGSEEPSLCKAALSVPVWPQSFQSPSLCCAQTCISMTSVQGPNVPFGATQTPLAPLLPGSLSTYLKKDINPRLPTSFQSYCQPSPHPAHTVVGLHFSEHGTGTVLPTESALTCPWVYPLSLFEPLNSMSSGSFFKSSEGDKCAVTEQTVGTKSIWPTCLPSDIPRYLELTVRTLTQTETSSRWP